MASVWRKKSQALIALLLVVLLMVVGKMASSSGGGEAAGESPMARDDAAEESRKNATTNGDSSPSSSEGSEGDGSAREETGAGSALDSTFINLMEEGVTKRVSERCLVDEASDTLETYQAEGDCLLAEAGYLDLLGNVWSCTVVGDGWVDVVVVRAVQAEGETEVTTVRMDAETWARELAEEEGVP